MREVLERKLMQVQQEELEAQGLVLVTTTADYNEPCYLLVEMDLLSAEFKVRSRYQLLYVVREVPGPHKEVQQQLAVLSTRLGPSDDYPYPELRLAGGAKDPRTGKLWIEETVGSMLALADDWRLTADNAEKRRIEVQEGSTLFEDFIIQTEQARDFIDNRSVHGPYFRKENHGYHRRKEWE